jgi:FixJ family two-component response regulator
MGKEQKAAKYLSVVVLEDNDGDFVLIEDYLIEAYNTVKISRCETFDDFMQLKETKSGFNFDLILLDLHLPDQSGIQLIENVISIKPPVPVIILTGYTELPLAKESLKLGVEDFLIKDEISTSILLKSIEYALSRSLYIRHIQAQNEKLRNVAWTQSHVVRAPLARMLGIINLIEGEKYKMNDLKFWLSQLRISSNELDDIVRKITKEGEELLFRKENE